jgi:ABC-2 type transport system ATP-binding protein
MEDGTVLELQALGKKFAATTAVDELSLVIGRGELVGLLGPNGAGKTTTLKLVLGMLRPTRGRALALGLDCTSRAIEVRRLVGYSPDEPAFYDFLTGRETLDFVCDVRGGSRAETWRMLEPLIDALDFSNELDRFTAGYSHGMKKKLALLVAMAHSPRLLLLDEPTNGLDPPTAVRVRQILRDLAATGVAVVLSTHLLDTADKLCQRVLLLDQGRLLFDGSPLAARERAALGREASLEDAFLSLIGKR